MEDFNNEIYVAWQSNKDRSWHVVGQLKVTPDDKYIFRYTLGAKIQDNFYPFIGFDELEKVYKSNTLFPFFTNRILSKKRPEYSDYLSWFKLNENNDSVINILSRSNGLRNTDNIQIFNKLTIKYDGYLKYYFFIHGLGYLEESLKEKIKHFRVGSELKFIHSITDINNNSTFKITKDNNVIGYVPRYLNKTIDKLQKLDVNLKLEIDSNNIEAPYWYKVICKISGRLTENQKNEFYKFQKEDSEYQPIIDN